MGNIIKNKKKNNELIIHLINYNSNLVSNSIYSNNILNNLILNYKNKNVIFCVQGLREEAQISDEIEKENIIINNELGLLTYTNLQIYKNSYLLFNNKSKYNNLKYGFQKIYINSYNNKLNIYNVELIPNSLDINNNEIRNKQLNELLCDIYKNNFKINIIFACFYNYCNKMKKLINIANISNLINFENNENYIFIYSKKIINKIEDINKYLSKEFNIEIIEQNLYTFNDSYPFELILKLKKIAN